jgi:hypothetical protein
MGTAGLDAGAAGAALRAGLPLEIVSVEVTRAASGTPARPRPRRLFRAAWGWPLPRATGPAVDVPPSW